MFVGRENIFINSLSSDQTIYLLEAYFKNSFCVFKPALCKCNKFQLYFSKGYLKRGMFPPKEI